MAILLEFLPGLFGFLGFGWIYAGNVAAGIFWLFGYLLWFVGAAIGSVITGGFGCFLSVPITIVLLVISITSLNAYTRAHPELFGN
jgi:hypothetical protein